MKLCVPAGMYQAHVRDRGYSLAAGRRRGAVMPQQGASLLSGSIWCRGLLVLRCGGVLRRGSYVVAALTALFHTSPACIAFETLA